MAPAQREIKFAFRNVLLTKSPIPASVNGESISWMRGLRINTIRVYIAAPVPKLKRRKLITVATNMAAVARFGNPFRLSSFQDQVLLGKSAEGETNTKMTTDVEKITMNTPDIELVGELNTASLKHDAP